MDLYNVNDGLTGRDGCPYLDQIEQERAEIARAKVEGREPNLEAPGGCAGTVYVTGEQLLHTESLNNVPSQNLKAKAALELAVLALVEDESNPIKVAFVAPDTTEELPVEEVIVEEVATETVPEPEVPFDPFAK